MKLIERLRTTLAAAAARIREKTGNAEAVYFDDIPAKIDEVFEAGKTVELNEIWERIQCGGTRANYGYAFSYTGWNRETFKPLYDIGGTTHRALFLGQKTLSGDLEQLLNECGVKLDTSETTYAYEMFRGASNITKIPALRLGYAAETPVGWLLTDMTSLQSASIDIGEFGISGAGMFDNCVSLTDLTVTGVIRIPIRVQWSPLTHDSLMSIINALADFSTSETTATLTLGAANIGKLTADELLIITNKGWTYA